MISSEYAAGIIDGEGCIQLAKCGDLRPGYIRLIVAVKMTDKMVPEALLQAFGGKIYLDRSKKKGHRLTYSWRITGKEAANFLQHTLNFLITKRKQAELALIFQSKINFDENGKTSKKRLTQEIIDERVSYYEEMRELNKRGT